MALDPKVIRDAMVTPRWTGLVRLDASPAAIAQWDPTLLRECRVIVPVDVQALYVPAGDETPYVRLPYALTTPDGSPPEAPPDSLLRGSLTDVNDGSRNRLGMPPLPDRWVVLRIITPQNATKPIVTG